MEIMSTNAFGPSDLDTRPPEMRRSTMVHWVQECPYCGYCNQSITLVNKGYSELIKTESYRDQLNNKDYPQLANRFLCNSFLTEMDKSYKKSGLQSLYAAWACDDSPEYSEVAIKCRERAYNLFLLAKSNGQNILGNDLEDGVILVDLLRRMKRFDESLEKCIEEINKNSNDLLKMILEYEKLLIENKDSDCHNIGEIEKL
jgi:hypothetical protein